jgi:ABC-2 type transport system permease protein
VSALLALLRKELYHIGRDRRTLAVIVLMPIVQVVLFGFAISTDVKHVRLAIVDPTPDAETLALRQRFASTKDTFELAAVVSHTGGLEALFQRGTAQAALVFEPGFASRMGESLPARLLLLVDATEPNTGSAIQGYVTAVVDAFARERGTTAAVRIVPAVQMAFNPTRESKHLFVPGLMAFVLTIVSALMTAISLTREKETGTIEALLVSPLHPWQIVVGKVLPYLGVGFISVLAVVGEARLVFDVPVRGSVALLLAEGLLFILVSLSLGILISARTSSQRVAMMGALIGTMLPTMLLSGFMFPIESMPRALQIASQAVPARWFVEIARAVMLKGVGLEVLWQETVVLAGMALLLLTLSARSFHERLE